MYRFRIFVAFLALLSPIVGCKQPSPAPSSENPAQQASEAPRETEVIVPPTPVNSTNDVPDNDVPDVDKVVEPEPAQDTIAENQPQIKPEAPKSCMREDYLPWDASRLIVTDEGKELAVNKRLDDKLQPSQKSEGWWYEAPVVRTGNTILCEPYWPISLDGGPWYENAMYVTSGEICQYHCNVGLAGTQYENDRFVCKTPTGIVQAPASPRGYHCLNVETMRKIEYGFGEHFNNARQKLFPQDDERMGLRTWSLNLKDIARHVNPYYQTREEPYLETVDLSLPGFVCSASDYYDNACICGGKTVPFGTVCNNESVVTACQETCPCGDGTIGPGMYCDQGTAYCGTNKVPQELRGFSCVHGVLWCEKSDCSDGKHHYSQGVFRWDNDILACASDKGCTVDGKPIPGDAFIYNGVQGTSMKDGVVYCGEVALSDNMIGVACENGHLICKSDSCQYETHVISKGMLIAKSKDSNRDIDFECANPDGCTIDGKTIAQYIIINNHVEYCGEDGANPGNGFVCRPYRQDGVSKNLWICDLEECRFRGIKVEKGKPLSSIAASHGIYAECKINECLCGETPIHKHALCKDGIEYCQLSVDDSVIEPATVPDVHCVQFEKEQFSQNAWENLDRCGRFWNCEKDPCGAIVENPYPRTVLYVKGLVPKRTSKGFNCNDKTCNCGVHVQTISLDETRFTCEKVTNSGHTVEMIQFHCGDIVMEVSNPADFPFRCASEIGKNVLECIGDSCSYWGREFHRNDICNASRCIHRWELPDYYESDFCTDPDDVCCTCGLGTCSCGLYDGRNHWYAKLLESKDEVCVNGNCPCGSGVCGKLGICRDGACYCGNSAEFPKSGNDVCGVYLDERKIFYGYPSIETNELGYWY